MMCGRELGLEEMSCCDEGPVIACDEVDTRGSQDSLSESLGGDSTMLEGDGDSDEGDCVLAEVLPKYRCPWLSGMQQVSWGTCTVVRIPGGGLGCTERPILHARWP